MEVPEFSLYDTGDTGSFESNTLPRPVTQLPARARSSSPRSPHNVQGLPPSYLAHLRALIRQWLEQTYKNDSSTTDRATARLWTQEQITQIQKALWESVILPSGDQSHLLDIDWVDWAARSAKRKEAWREYCSQSTRDAQQNELRPDEVTKDKLGISSVLNTPLLSPRLTPSRSSSAASVRQTPPLLPESLGDLGQTEEIKDPEIKRAEFFATLSKLPGFQALSTRDEWELVDGK